MPNPIDDAGGQGNAKIAPTIIIVIENGDQGCRTDKQKRGKDDGVTAITSKPKPTQGPIEDADKEGEIGNKANDPCNDQRIPCLIVRAIRAGIARLNLSQLGWVEGIEGNPHRFWAIANQGAQRIDGIL